jgi:hypothetical protein
VRDHALFIFIDSLEEFFQLLPILLDVPPTNKFHAHIESVHKLSLVHNFVSTTEISLFE